MRNDEDDGSLDGFQPETIKALCQKAMRERDEADERIELMAQDYEALSQKHKAMFANFSSMSRRAHEAEERLAQEIDARMELQKRFDATLKVAKRLVDYIDNEGPPAKEWQAISDTTSELGALIGNGGEK